ncbi:MAG: PQQ-binding-like beta-propeller repeat protein [Acidobacteria bacterium]|nr:PQQ-binding-like beta-propeller repeat protein [Acidobacteriota bacterium]MYK88007.1 PQQ-binding-like beta-propeller repeat protein [Acidobacteriota bacterium]
MIETGMPSDDRVVVRRAIVAALVVAAGAVGSAQEWTGWRGPERDGIVAASRTLEAWPEAFARAWQVEIGEGYSSPVVSGGRVFLHSREGDREVVTGFDLSTGARLWRRDYPALYVQNDIVPGGLPGPFATPVVDGGRVFTLGAAGILSSWDAASGALLWRNDYSESVQVTGLFCGTSASPLVDGGKLIVQVGSDAGGGRVLALDPATGDEVWVWRGVGPGYASPIVVEIEGHRQVVTLTESSVVGIDAANGALLWSMPFTDEWHENIMTPVWTGAHLVVSGPRQGTHAFAIRRENDGWRAAPGWSNARVTMYMSSPVLTAGTLYGHSSTRSGQFVALDAASGAVQWASEGREGDLASVLLAGDDLLLLNSDAELVVAEPNAEAFAVARQYEVADGATWSMPVPLPDGLLVRDATSLVRLVPAAHH